jgi:hypothetical protein
VRTEARKVSFYRLVWLTLSRKAELSGEGKRSERHCRPIGSVFESLPESRPRESENHL